MPSVLEREETLLEIQALPTYQEPRQAQPRISFFKKLICLFKGNATRSEYSAEFSACLETQEMPLDTTARKYPYMYADALLG